MDLRFIHITEIRPSNKGERICRDPVYPSVIPDVRVLRRNDRQSEHIWPYTSV